MNENMTTEEIQQRQYGLAGMADGPEVCSKRKLSGTVEIRLVE